jgi:hypothetical protein
VLRCVWYGVLVCVWEVGSFVCDENFERGIERVYVVVCEGGGRAEADFVGSWRCTVVGVEN